MSFAGIITLMFVGLFFRASDIHIPTLPKMHFIGEASAASMEQPTPEAPVIRVVDGIELSDPSTYDSLIHESVPLSQVLVYQQPTPGPQTEASANGNWLDSFLQNTFGAT